MMRWIKAEYEKVVEGAMVGKETHEAPINSHDHEDNHHSNIHHEE